LAARDTRSACADARGAAWSRDGYFAPEKRATGAHELVDKQDLAVSASGLTHDLSLGQHDSAVQPVGVPIPTRPTAVSQAVRTTGLAARMRTHSELRAPLLPMAAAVAGMAMIGVAHYMAVAPPAPALHPEPRHADLQGRHVWHRCRGRLRRRPGGRGRQQARAQDSRLRHVPQPALAPSRPRRPREARTRRPRHARDGYPSCAKQGRGARRVDPRTDHPASESFRARRTDRCLARQRRPRPRTRGSGGTRSSARPQAAADDPLAGAPRVNLGCGLKTRTWDEVRPALINMVEAARQARSSPEEKPVPPSGGSART
jgi:hypothetical protein